MNRMSRVERLIVWLGIAGIFLWVAALVAFFSIPTRWRMGPESKPIFEKFSDFWFNHGFMVSMVAILILIAVFVILTRDLIARKYLSSVKKTLWIIGFSLWVAPVFHAIYMLLHGRRDRVSGRPAGQTLPSCMTRGERSMIFAFYCGLLALAAGIVLTPKEHEMILIAPSLVIGAAWMIVLFIMMRDIFSRTYLSSPHKLLWIYGILQLSLILIPFYLRRHQNRPRYEAEPPTGASTRT